MVHTASSVTVDGIDNLLQSAGHASLPSSGSLGSLRTLRAQTNPPAHQEPAISQRPFLLQKDPPKRSKSAVPQISSTLSLKSKKSTLRKATKHTQGVRTENKERKKNKSSRATQEAPSPTPQPPAKEGTLPSGPHDEERAYIRNRCKRALANGPVVAIRLSRDISEKV
ncbi:hypothetical protein FS837_003168 [Tulasnella sp. UAMH 9824]|nr:hypothetical protein FS837_003168 [Tulasnella sp. UAMH 9824]